MAISKRPAILLILGFITLVLLTLCVKNVSIRNEVEIEDPLIFMTNPADKSDTEQHSLSTSMQISVKCGAVQLDELKYTVNKIKSSRLITSPFPHVFIENIYPNRVYECMLANIPSSGSEGNGTALIQTQKKPRFAIKLRTDTERIMVSSDTLGLPNWKFWTSYTKLLGGNEVARAWVRLFERTLKKRGISRFAKLGYSLDLNRDLAGYYIAPHTDSVNKLVTTLYYLPRSAANADIGTTMYKPLENAKSRGAKVTKFRAIKQAKFVPNSVLAFAPCKSSWHGVEDKKLHQGITRDTIQAFVRMAGGSRTKAPGLNQCP